MIRIADIPELRRQIAGWRAQGSRIALVPTMGNLHAGHLALVRSARDLAGRVVVSIFVNPLQFGPSEDFAAYPRTLERDAEQLTAEGADLLFVPTVDGMYPRGQGDHTRIEVPGLSAILCGASRPGHFVGVATVVCKLLNLAQPDLALFGEKDFQQLIVIRRMAEDLCLPVDIRGLPTVREPDGLAMSSRNAYLQPAERALAPGLYHALLRAAERLRAGSAVGEVEAQGLAELMAGGLEPEYLSVRRAADLASPRPDDLDLVVLAAARLGRARLIDNCRVRLGSR